jgi:hypothetical protein
MAYTTFSGPVRSLNGFATPVAPIAAATTLTSATVGGDYVILSAADGGPSSAIAVTLPTVVGTSTNPDATYNGIRGGLFNANSTGVTHTVNAAAGQTVNGAASVNVPPLHFAEWIGNGNQNAPWLCRISPLVAASV